MSRAMAATVAGSVSAAVSRAVTHGTSAQGVSGANACAFGEEPECVAEVAFGRDDMGPRDDCRETERVVQGNRLRPPSG